MQRYLSRAGKGCSILQHRARRGTTGAQAIPDIPLPRKRNPSMHLIQSTVSCDTLSTQPIDLAQPKRFISSFGLVAAAGASPPHIARLLVVFAAPRSFPDSLTDHHEWHPIAAQPPHWRRRLQTPPSSRYIWQQVSPMPNYFAISLSWRVSTRPALFFSPS